MSLRSKAAVERAQFDVETRLTVTPTHGSLVHAPPLTEAFRLGVDARQLSTAALALLSMNSSALAALSLADLNTSCALQPVLDAGVRGLELRMSALDLSLQASGGQLDILAVRWEFPACLPPRWRSPEEQQKLAFHETGAKECVAEMLRERKQHRLRREGRNVLRGDVTLPAGRLRRHGTTRK